MIKKTGIVMALGLMLYLQAWGRSPSFQTYMNPVIPGDHPDCTLSKFGNHFYTAGSSFATTPIIYHSTDLVHWEAISQPVSNSWTFFGTNPTDGCWGGHLVYHGGKYWYFFGRSARMFFVTADSPEGPWSSPPIEVRCPPSVPGLGMDNSIFIDDDGSWYLLVKNGQENNWIVQLGDDGQPSGAIYDLRWINPAPTYPYSWAEGPVMWKHKGYYYYSFAIHIYATQRVMRSPVLTDDPSSWEFLGNFFNEEDPKAGSALFRFPNHCSPAIMLEDSTWWVMYHSYGLSDWEGVGRQGLLSQVHYDAQGKPVADFPINEPRPAPNLPSSGIPWMVPKSDFFDSERLNPEWRLLGYCPVLPYSLTERSGWIRLTPSSRNKHNTIIKSDAERNYALITRMDFDPQASTDEAGLRIMTGLQNLSAKLYVSLNSEGKKIIVFSFGNTRYETENTIGNTVWLKIVRTNHTLTGYFGREGRYWTQLGDPINVSSMDRQQDNWNAFTGNRQGLYVIGKTFADFDLYIYRDAYTPILAECYANQFGCSRSYSSSLRAYTLDNIHANDWAMYAGVEFGGRPDYDKTPELFKAVASTPTGGGTIEIWLDSLDTGEKIGECTIGSTGDWKVFQTFTASVKPVTGRHDVYLKFKGTTTEKLFQLQSFSFTFQGDTTSVRDRSGSANLSTFLLEQNFPNPFNPSTHIPFRVPSQSFVTLTIHDVQGRKVSTLVSDVLQPGHYTVTWDASHLPSGLYICHFQAESTIETRKIVLLR